MLVQGSLIEASHRTMPDDPQSFAPSSNPDTILIVVPKLVIGGMERHLLQVLPALRQRGFEIEVFPLRGPGPLDRQMTAAGVPVAAFKPPLPADGHLCGRLNALAGTCALRRQVARSRTRLVHFFLPEAYLLGGFLGGTGRVPIRLMSRRSLNIYHDRHPVSRHAEARLHRRMDAVLGNSQAVVQDLVTEGVASERLGLIYNGVQIERFADLDGEAARRTLDIAPDALVLSMVANLIPYKGHADLLEALAQAKAALPANWHLLLAGRDDGIGDDLRAQARQLGLATHLRWLGAISDIGPVLAASDIVLQPSHEEGLPNAVLEAMAAGKPVIASRVGGLPEIVVPDETGILLPARNPDALAESLIRLANDPSRRKAMGQAGLWRVRERFGLETCVESYARLYSGLLCGDRRPVSALLSSPAPDAVTP